MSGDTMGTHWTWQQSAAVSGLVEQVAANPWGTMSPSVYETARLVRTAAWLEGHRARCDFLLGAQHPDGRWGNPDGYDLVPTLSATEALLNALNRRNPPELSSPSTDLMVRATTKGLRALSERLGPDGGFTIPDTIGAEFIVPWLIEEINNQLETARWSMPHGVDQQVLPRLRRAVLAGRPLPEKAWHTLEALGPLAAGAPGVRLIDGAVGSSPAATAAWLADMPHTTEATSVGLLTANQARNGGPVPGVISIATFERAWVLGWLLDAGVPMNVPTELLSYLRNSLGESGAAAGPGLPEDSDDTAAVLHALALAGLHVTVDSLWLYEGEFYFHCFPNERTPSTSTNAHVLDALLSCALDDGEHERRQAAARKIENWLLSQQHQDGSWLDKWHASPYYATMCCCTVALARGRHPDKAVALGRARWWVIEEQRADGSWGRWQGTVEETAYVLQILLRSHPATMPHDLAQAVARGCAYLLRKPHTDDFPPLWHDKDLYAPAAVITAARIAALHTAAARSDLKPVLVEVAAE
jgi:hypothetical protein